MFQCVNVLKRGYYCIINCVYIIAGILFYVVWFFEALPYFWLQGKEIETTMIKVTADPPIPELTIEDPPPVNGYVDLDEKDKNRDNMSASSQEDQNISAPSTERRESSESQVCVTL